MCVMESVRYVFVIEIYLFIYAFLSFNLFTLFSADFFG